MIVLTLAQKIQLARTNAIEKISELCKKYELHGQDGIYMPFDELIDEKDAILAELNEEIEQIKKEHEQDNCLHLSSEKIGIGEAQCDDCGKVFGSC